MARKTKRTRKTGSRAVRRARPRRTAEVLPAVLAAPAAPPRPVSKPLWLIDAAAVLLGLYFVIRGHWITGMVLFVLTVIVNRLTFGERKWDIPAPTDPPVPAPAEGAAAPTGEIPRPSVNWILLGIGSVLGWYGVQLLSQSPPAYSLGIPVHLAAIWMIYHAFSKRSGVMAGEPSFTMPAVSSTGPEMIAFFLPVVVALGVLMQYGYRAEHFRMGTIYLGLLVAVMMLTRWTAPEKPGPSSSRWESVGLLFVLVVALAMRFPFLDSMFSGFQTDEGNNMEAVLQILRWEIKTPWATAWWGTPTLPYFVIAPFFHELGSTLPIARGVSALFSILSILFLYRLLRSFFSVTASLVTVWLFTWSWWHMFYALSPFHNIMSLFYTVAAFFFLDRAFRGGRRGDFFMVGLMAAFAVINYIPSRMVPFMVFFSCLGLAVLWRGRFVAAYARHLVLSLAAFLWFTGPFLIYAFKNPDLVFGRLQQLSIMTVIQHTGDWLFPLKTLGYTAVSFLWASPNVDPRFGLANNPVLDVVTGFLLVVGAGLLLTDWKSRLTWFVVPGFLLGLTANAFAVQHIEHVPFYLNPMRYFIILPFAVLLVARGVEWTLHGIRAQGVVLRLALTALLIAGLGWAAYFNARIYYRDNLSQPPQWQAMGMEHVMVGRECLKHMSREHVLVYWQFYPSVVRVMLDHQPGAMPLMEDAPLPLNLRAQKDVVFVMSEGVGAAATKRVLEAYPGATSEILKNPWDHPIIRVIRVSKSEYESRQAGMELKGDLP